jgi:hypothetical protein
LNAQPAQTSQPPQSARQALLEMFFGQGPNHLEKHLPEITKKALRPLDSGGGPSFLTELGAIGMQAKAAGGGNLQTMETGPILLVAEQPAVSRQTQGLQKFEVVVDRDDLVGDEDQIDLSFHMYQNGKPETLPFLPRLTFMMKMESNVWRLNELSFSARMPLADSDFLKDFVNQMQEKQQRSSENSAAFSLRAIVAAESAYHASHPDRGFTCSLSDLASLSKDTGGERPMMPIDDELARGKAKGYVYAMTGCDSSHYKVAAEPATSGPRQRAFCTDESGVIKFSKNGKAATCLSSGEPLSQGPAGVSVID